MPIHPDTLRKLAGMLDATPPPAADAVSEAMVEAAREHLYDFAGNKLPKPLIRKAIAAALAARGK